jgi:hypothetical protein
MMFTGYCARCAAQHYKNVLLLLLLPVVLVVLAAATGSLYGCSKLEPVIALHRLSNALRAPPPLIKLACSSNARVTVSAAAASSFVMPLVPCSDQPVLPLILPLLPVLHFFATLLCELLLVFTLLLTLLFTVVSELLGTLLVGAASVLLVVSVLLVCDNGCNG